MAAGRQVKPPALFLCRPDFWHDAWIQPAIYPAFGMPVPWEGQPRFRLVDSGQLLLDRCVCTQPPPPLPPRGQP
jgi:hypothetical protein